MSVRQTDKSQEIRKLNPSLNSRCCENKHVGVSEVPRVSAKVCASWLLSDGVKTST